MKNIKVGDKVRCLRGDGYLTKNKVYKVTAISTAGVHVTDNFGDLSIRSLKIFEPITKTLDNLEVGDVLVKEGFFDATVEAICGNIVGTSYTGFKELSVTWDHLSVLKEQGWKLKEELEPKVKKAIKLLEEKGYKVTQ